jgi:hypothetical protein
MTRKRLFPPLAVLAALSLVVAACGQKSGVHLASTGSGGDDAGSVEGGEGAIGETTASGEVIIGYDEAGNAITAPAGSAAAGGGPATGGGATTRTGQRGGTTATTAAAEGAAPTTKVWGKTITIGIHAPITGAAPLPSTFQAAANFVRDYYNAKGGIHGRSIAIEIVDDQYQPAIATQRCTELVKQKNAFLLIGAAGTDQIQACARYAATAGVPYLSAGVTEKGLTTLKNYFAISMTYKQQVPYLVNYMKQTFPTAASDPSKVYMVYSDTPNFGDALSAWREAFPGAKTIKLSRVPSQSELGAAARELCTPPQAQLAFPLMAPKDWLFVLGQQTCKVQWAGIGVTMGINEVAKNGCRTAGTNFNGSTFFSPFPGIDKAQAMDPEFKNGTQGKTWDDIWVALWGTTKGIVQILDKVGPDLTRAKFVTTTENTTNLSTGLSPPLSYTPTNHFGAKQTHVLKAVCTGQETAGKFPDGHYQTPTTFLSY